LKEDGKIDNQMVKVAGQPCQSQWVAYFGTVVGFENYIQRKLGELIWAKDLSVVFLVET